MAMRNGLRRVSKKQQKELALRSRLKKELMAECEMCCQSCGTAGDFRGMALHHKIRLSQGGKTEKSNLEILCGKCHSLAHNIREA